MPFDLDIPAPELTPDEALKRIWGMIYPGQPANAAPGEVVDHMRTFIGQKDRELKSAIEQGAEAVRWEEEANRLALDAKEMKRLEEENARLSEICRKAGLA